MVVNTCSVTAEADREARAYIRRTHRKNPGAKIVVTGCYAQRAPQELASLPGVAAVVGNSHKGLTPQVVEALSAPSHSPADDREAAGFVNLQTLLAGSQPGSAAMLVDDRFAHSFLEEAQVIPGAQTRPNLKIQEGCSNRCTFCVIPQTRGNSRSLAAEKIVAQVQGFLEAGGQELVFSGINLGRWGRDLMPGKQSLAGLLRRIFAETSLPRLRLSSIEPMDWDAELLAIVRDFAGSDPGPLHQSRNRLARHAHLPLQSGSDAVLRRMHRRYRPWHYAEKVNALREAAGPQLTLGADVMVGFPGETDQEFAETMELVRQLPFGYLHIFPFSPRPGTRGWSLHREMPVAPDATRERIAELRALGRDKLQQHRASFVGQVLDCVTLNTPDALRARGSCAALSENFLPVELQQAGVRPNQMICVRITDLAADGTLIGAQAE